MQQSLFEIPMMSDVSQPALQQCSVSGSGGKISEQVFVRLIMSGMYPIRQTNGKGWIYFISPEGHYVGTPKSNDFETYWKETLYFLGEGQMSESEIAEVRKLDYQLTDEYKEKFEKWKAKVLGQ